MYAEKSSGPRRAISSPTIVPPEKHSNATLGTREPLACQRGDAQTVVDEPSHSRRLGAGFRQRETPARLIPLHERELSFPFGKERREGREAGARSAKEQ